MRAGGRRGPAHGAGGEIQAAHGQLAVAGGDGEQAAAERDRPVGGPALLDRQRPGEPGAAALQVDRGDRVGGVAEHQRAGQLDRVERRRLRRGPPRGLAGEPGHGPAIGRQLDPAAGGDRHGRRAAGRWGDGRLRHVAGLAPDLAAVHRDDPGERGAAHEVQEARDRLAGAAARGERVGLRRRARPARAARCQRAGDRVGRALAAIVAVAVAVAADAVAAIAVVEVAAIAVVAIAVVVAVLRDERELGGLHRDRGRGARDGLLLPHIPL